MVSRGERPGYRLQPGQDGTWAVDGLPGVIVTAPDHRAALAIMRAAIAADLGVAPDSFDLE